MTVPVNLVYSSALFDPYSYTGTQAAQTVTYGAGQTSASGGWHFQGYNYGLYQVASQVQNCVAYTNSNNQLVPVSPPPFQFGLILPDGAHHMLKLYGQTDTYSNYSYWFNPVTGQNPCTQQTLASPLIYYTDDGSYIRVSVDNSNPSKYQTGGPYIIYLPDGTQITSTGWGAWANGQPVAALAASGIISDRNGNKVTITENSNGATVLTDDLSRTITIGNGQVTQTGAGGSSLTWTLGSYNTFTVSPTCSNPGFQGCGSYLAGGPGYLQVPADAGTSASTVQYQFGYDPTSGQLTSVTLPSGAVTTYTYGSAPGTTKVGLTTFYNNSVVTGKTVAWTDTSDGGSSARSENWSYQYGCPGVSTAGPTCSTKITAPDTGVHTTTFKGTGPLMSTVTKETEPDGSGTEYLYQQNPAFDEAAQSAGGTNSANPYIAMAVHVVAQGGTASFAAVDKRTVDQNGNLTGDAQYDWIAYSLLTHDTYGALTGFSGGSALRSIANTYQSAVPVATNAAGPPDNANGYWNPAAPLLRGLLSRSVTTGAGYGAIAEFSYDGKGNEQQERHWDSNKAASQPSSLSASNSDVTVRTFDNYGNVLSITDPNENLQSFTYDSNSLYITKQVQASGSLQQRTFTYGWDNTFGLVTSKTDADNQVTTDYTYDPIGRQISVTEAATSPLKRYTQTLYNDAALQVTVKKDQATFQDGLIRSTITYDQLYRVALTQQFESPSDTSGIKVQTRYAYTGNNSYKLVSMPYRAATSGAASGESTMGWVLATIDQNGRTVYSQTYAGSAPPSPWGSNGASTGTVTTGYSSPNAKSTTVTDQEGAQRVTSVDGLGRLSSVTEYPNSGTYTTTYSYDALGDLTAVAQSSEARTFVYDSQKRLIASTNPETYSSGSAPALGCAGGTYTNCYYYDSNGNLTSKTDNRGVGVAYGYDALNRVRSKSYFNLPGTVNYQAVAYTYDDPNVPNSRGRLTAVSTLAGTYRLASDTSITNYLGYDALGRITSSSQTTGGSTYVFSNYGYNLADALTSETYPSGRVLQSCYDGANRVTQVGGTCGSTSGAFASNFTYAVHGAPTQYVMGNNVWHAPAYNSRLQMSGFIDSVGGSAADELLNVSLAWAPSGGTGDNGNLYSATYNNGGPGYPAFLTFTQTFNYDGVNRLTSASDSGGWSRNFSYDAYGNMTPSGNPAPPTVSFNGNNQIVGQQYDQAGDLISANGNTLAYDVENMVATETDGISKAVETYVYDGNGKRVEKYGPGGTPKTTFVYDAMGLLAAEYSTATNNSPCTTCYLTPDHLGTIRLITDQNGNVVSRHDYLPFGEEVAANSFGRDSHWGVGGDTVNQKFTGKERDSESGLDYFGARYYGSSMGRFMSPDHPLIDQHPENPQSWNLYAYARNNPLINIDPTGLGCITDLGCQRARKNVEI
jgi:RHS repeat-associated protein